MYVYFLPNTYVNQMFIYMYYREILTSNYSINLK